MMIKIIPAESPQEKTVHYLQSIINNTQRTNVTSMLAHIMNGLATLEFRYGQKYSKSKHHSCYHNSITYKYRLRNMASASDKYVVKTVLKHFVFPFTEIYKLWKSANPKKFAYQQYVEKLQQINNIMNKMTSNDFNEPKTVYFKYYNSATHKTIFRKATLSDIEYICHSMINNIKYNAKIQNKINELESKKIHY